jgi:hypothetical protein
MMSSIFWDITPCSPLKVNRRFGGTYPLLHNGSLLGLFVDPEDAGDMISENATWPYIQKAELFVSYTYSSQLQIVSS